MNKMIIGLIIFIVFFALVNGISLTYGQEQEKPADVKMEIQLMQIPSNDSWKEYDFEVRDYDIKVEGKNIDILKENNVRSHRISMDKRAGYLDNLGTSLNIMHIHVFRASKSV